MLERKTMALFVVLLEMILPTDIIYMKYDLLLLIFTLRTIVHQRISNRISLVIMI